MRPRRGVHGRPRVGDRSTDSVVARRLQTDPPFDVGADALFVAYMASAEMGCFLQLGWPMPVNVLDLYAEFRCETNGRTLPHGRGLLGALSYHALSSITKEEKQDMRDLVLTGGPWTEQQRRDILAYCQAGC